MTPFRLRRDAGLLLVAALAGWLFFSSLGRLWPLADADLNVAAPAREQAARAFLQARGLDLSGFRAASALAVDETTLDYVEGAFGRARAQALIQSGLPLVTYGVNFKKAGAVDGYSVTLGPAGNIAAWSSSLQEDEPGPAVPEAAARILARRGLEDSLGLDLSVWRAAGASTRVLPARTDHVFTFERFVSRAPELRERALARIAGNRVVAASRFVVTPASAGRAVRRSEAPRQALFTMGTILFAAGVLAALTVFLLRLRDGSVRLGQAALWSGVVFLLSLIHI